MRRNNPSKTTNHVKKDGKQDSKGNRVKKELTLGEVIWVKTNPSSWWLGQVVDDNLVNVERKPKRKSVGEVLVRLYGTYSYLYADPEKYHDELMEILKQNNGSDREMFQKALEQEIAYTKSNALKRKTTERKAENVRDGAPKDKKLKPNGVNENEEADGLSSGSMGKLPKVRFRELRTRKAKGSKNLEDVGGSKRQVNSGDLSRGRARKKASEVEISKQDGVKKGNEADYQGTEIANEKSTSLKRKASESEGCVQARDGDPKDKKSKQIGVNKSQEVGCLSSANMRKLSLGRTRISRPRKAKDSINYIEGVNRARAQVNIGAVSSRKTRKETSKTDNSKQDGAKKGKTGDNQGSAKDLPEKLGGVSGAKTPVKGADLSAGRTKKEASKSEIIKQDGVKKGQKTDNQDSETDILEKSPDLGLRRVRVMKTLGLVAPCGSPFKQK